MCLATCIHSIRFRCSDFIDTLYLMQIYSKQLVFWCSLAVNDHGGQVAPWEEENGFYSVMVGVPSVLCLCVLVLHVLTCSLAGLLTTAASSSMLAQEDCARLGLLCFSFVRHVTTHTTQSSMQLDQESGTRWWLADGPQTAEIAGLVIQSLQTVVEDVFIWSVGPEWCVTSSPYLSLKNPLTYVYSHSQYCAVFMFC